MFAVHAASSYHMGLSLHMETQYREGAALVVDVDVQQVALYVAGHLTLGEICKEADDKPGSHLRLNNGTS